MIDSLFIPTLLFLSVWTTYGVLLIIKTGQELCGPTAKDLMEQDHKNQKELLKIELANEKELIRLENQLDGDEWKNQ